MSDHIYPVTIDGDCPDLKLGDVFTMEVPVHPGSGAFPWSVEDGGEMRVMKFRVAKVIAAKG